MESKITEIKQYWKKFEDLAVEFIQQTYCKSTNYKFIQTRYQKDGGFDAKQEAEVFENDTVLSLLEAKLRNSNLDLRDISASVIIAFNLGAYCIFIVTNHSSTPQLMENIEMFQRKTNLKIKLVDGMQLSKWVEPQQRELTEKGYPRELLEYLGKPKRPARTKKTKNIEAPPKASIPENPAIEAMSRKNGSHVFSHYIFETKQLLKHSKALTGELNNRAIAVVKGGQGLGKSVLVENARRMLGSEVIFISCDMAYALSCRIFFLQLLSGILGLENYKALMQLESPDKQIIASIAGKTQKHDELEAILLDILQPNDASRWHSDVTSLLLTDYLGSLLTPYLPISNYIFCFHNIEYTPPEVLNFLSLLIETFKTKEIACIIEIRDPLTSTAFYDPQSWKRHVALFERLATSGCVHNIEGFTKEEAKAYISQRLPGLDDRRAEVVVGAVGNSPLLLDYAVRWLKEEKIINEYAENQHLIDQFEVFFNSISPQNAVAVVAQWIELLKAEYNLEDILVLLELFEGSIPLDIFLEISEQRQADELLERGLAKVEDGYFCVSHHLITQVLQHQSNGLSCYRVAKIVLPQLLALSEQGNETETVQLYIIAFQRACMQWEEVAQSGCDVANRLKQNFQFESACRYFAYAREAAKKIYERSSTAEALQAFIDAAIEELDNAIVVGRIGTPTYRQVIGWVESAVLEMPHNQSEYYSSAARYYLLKHNYERLHLDDAKEISESLLNAINNSPEIHKKNDLAGRILEECALITKSMNGYDPAHKVYKEYYEKFPSSEAIQVGLLSHISCMNLYHDPDQSINNIRKLIDFVVKKDLRGRFPLFHEYGDIAMASLIAKRYGEAMEHANYCNSLAKANGVWLQQGRAENFIACALWAQGNSLESVAYHLEKSCFMLEKANEGHYLWRSRLNLCSLYIETADSGKREKALALARAVAKHILSSPQRIIITLNKEEQDYRRYAAALQLYKAFENLGENSECDKMLLLLEKSPFKRHASDYCGNKLLSDSTFDRVIHNGRIWSLG